MSIKSSHTAGVDGLCSKMIKAIVNEIVDLLVYLINRSLFYGVVYDINDKQWKKIYPTEYPNSITILL